MPFSIPHDLNDFYNTFYHDLAQSQPDDKIVPRHHVLGDRFAQCQDFPDFKSMLLVDSIPINVEGLASFLLELENAGFVVNRSPMLQTWPKKIKLSSAERKALWQDQLKRVKSAVPYTDILAQVEPIILPDGKGAWDIDPKNKFDRHWFNDVIGEKYIGTTKGRNEGFQQLKQRALNNDLDAIHPYALWLMDNKEYDQAISLLHTAAERESADAHAELGRIYATGEGVDEDLALAKHHYEMAAASQHNQAFHALATLYEFGGKLGADIPLSFSYHLKAANAGNHLSMGCVAKQYYHGFGVEKDVEKALHYAQMGEECLDGTSLQVIGEYLGGELGEWDKALPYFEASASVGDPEGAHFAGWCLLTGNGAEPAPEVACNYLAKAADMGHVQSMFLLGGYYCEENNPTKNYPLSLYWLRKAAERDHAFALVILGKLHLSTDAEVLDYEQAYSYFERAGSYNFHKAFSFMSECHRLGWGVEADNHLAFSYMLKAAELGCKNAMQRVSQYYAEGFGTEMDYYQSDIWLQKYQRCTEDKPYHFVDQVYADALGYVIDTVEEQ